MIDKEYIDTLCVSKTSFRLW